MPGRTRSGMLALAFVLASLIGFKGARATGYEPLGVVGGSDWVSINNERALPGTAFFAGDVIATSKSSSAVMKFRSGASAILTENTEVTLPEDGALTSLTLRQGTLQIWTTRSSPAQVNVLGSSVMAKGEDGFPAICRVAVVHRSAVVIADRGHVEIHGMGAPLVLFPGKYARLEAGEPQGAGQQAGKVSNAIPDELLERQGKESPLKVNEIVDWEDLVRTLRTGRVRIALLDGSFLNVGARSTMRITKHDVASQQTEVELTLGRLRGEVIKLTKPGASFQVRTQTAVIGVVGTIFAVHALANLTRVYSIDGIISVRNINPAVVGEVTLRAGEYTTVARGVPPVGAARISAARIQTEVNQTNAQVGAPGGGPGGAVGAGRAVSTTALNATSTAATGTSAVLGGVAVSRVGQATSLLTQATSSANAATAAASDAATAAMNAASAANAAAAASTNLNVAIQTLIKTVSPSAPGCGCQP